MKDIIGYSIRYALFQNSRGIDPQKAGGRSSWTSAYRAAARDPAAIGIVDASLMGPLNASRRDPAATTYKKSRTRSERELQGYGFLFTQRFKPQATSIKPQAQRLKLQATSFKRQDSWPWKKFHGPLTEVLYQDECIAWMFDMKGNLMWRKLNLVTLRNF